MMQSPIPIDSAHVSKLMEMCKVLFPDKFPPHITEIAFMDEWGELYYRVGGEIQFVNWFLFVYFHIRPRLGEKKDLSLAQCIDNYMATNLNTHPVDYYYSIFKELK